MHRGLLLQSKVPSELGMYQPSPVARDSIIPG